MSEIFKIILSFFHNRNEGKMFVHPVTHDAHGLALKKRIRRSRILRLRQVAQATFFHSAAVRSARSVFYRMETKFPIQKIMCLGTFSRRGAVALATIYPCAECASSRSIFIVWKQSFLYDKKECVEVPAPAAASRVSDIFHSAAVRSAQKRLSGVFREPFFEFCILIAGRRSSFRLWA